MRRSSLTLSIVALVAATVFVAAPAPGADALAPLCSPQDATLGAYWRFDTQSGGATPDATVYNNTGTLLGGAVITTSLAAPTTFGNSGSLSLNATGAYVLASDTTGLPQAAAPRSIALWMRQKSGASTENSTLVSLGNGTGATQKFILQMGTSGGPTYLFTDGVNGANNIVITGGEIPSMDAWHHVVFTFDGTNWAYYLDGTFVKSGTFTVPILTVNNAVQIGARHDVVTGFFTGHLDDVRVYNRTLTAAEAASLGAGSCPAATGDLGITKTGSGTVNTGGNALYNLSVLNAGPNSATGVTVTDVIPAGTSYVPALSDPTCSATGGVVTCRNVFVGTGATRNLALAFAIPSAYACPSVLINTATVSGATLDPNPVNNSSTSTRPVNCLPGDLGIVKSASGTTLNPGGNALYNLRVSNFGTTSATGVTVRDAVPAGVTYVPAQSDVACTQSGGVVTCPNLTIGSGATRNLAIAFAIPSTYPCPTPLVNTATVTGSTLDPNLTNNTSTSTRTVTCPAASSSSSVGETTGGGGGNTGGGGGGGGRRPTTPTTPPADDNVAPPGTGGPENNDTFPDVVPNSFYEDAVRLFLERGFLDRSQTRFRPNDASTRAELTKLVIELHGGILNSPPSDAPSFDDVRPGTWYYGYMEDAGIRTWVRGDDNCYGRHPCTGRPNDRVTRAEAAAIIVRTFGFQATGQAPRFSDVPDYAWYRPWIQTAADHCILQGDAGRRSVRPDDRVTRAELVVMLSRAYDNLSYDEGCRQVGTRDRITSVSLTSPDTLELRFNTDIDPVSATDEGNFLLTCNGERPILSSRRMTSTTVELTLQNDLPAGRSCRLSVMGLEDGDGNMFSDSILFTSREPTSTSSSSSRISSRTSTSSSRMSSNSSSSL